MTLWHKQRAADATFEQAAVNYKRLLTAFQNVADALHAIEDDAGALKAAASSQAAAKRSLEIAGRHLQLGAINYLALLGAQNAYQGALSIRVQAAAARLADTAALSQALGGGWRNRNDVPPPAATEGVFDVPAFLLP